MRRFVFSIILTLLCVAGISPSSGLGYDLSDRLMMGHCHPGLVEMKNTYDSTMIATWSTAPPKDSKSEFKSRARFSVVRVIKDSKEESENIREGKILAESQVLFGPLGQRALVFGYTHSPEEYRYFQFHTPLTDEMLDYVENAPTADAPRTVMLAYLAKHFESTDQTVADDAFRYFEWLFEIKDIPEIRGQLSVEQLRKFLTNPDTPPMRIGLYALLLGYAGDESDISLLKQLSLRPAKPSWENGIRDLDWVFEGYLLLEGEQGLQALEESKLRDKSSSNGEFLSAMAALRFMAEHGDGRFTKDRLLQSMRIALDRQEMAIEVLGYFFKMQDWTVSDRLMELYGTTGYDSVWVKQVIVSFLLTAEATKPKDPHEPLPEHVLTAQKHLKTLREKDPETVKRAEKSFSGGSEQ